MNFFQALISNPFIQSALIAGLLASFASGLMGSYVVVKRVVLLSGSIAHSVLSGLGICLWLRRVYGIEWLEPIYGAFVASILSAVLIGWIHLNYKQREDAVIATIWTSGMATGVIFVSLTPGYNVELMNFLFGNILWVSHMDLVLLTVLDLILLFCVIAYYHRFLAICFDEEQARLRGLPVQGLYFLLLSLIAISVVLLIQVIGTILVIAFLAIPATIASLFTNRLWKMMVLSIILCVVFTLVGMGFSYDLNWPPGATIALTASIVYLLALVVKKRKSLA